MKYIFVWRIAGTELWPKSICCHIEFDTHREAVAHARCTYFAGVKWTIIMPITRDQ